MLIKKLIKRNVVDPVMSQRFTSSLGEVLSINNETNTATVEVNNQYGEGVFVLDKVHISLIGNGVHLKGLKVGDYVMVEFTGGMINNAKISNVLYRCYDDVKEDLKHKYQSVRIDANEKFIDKIQTQRDLIFNGDEIEFDNIKPFDFEREFIETINKISSYGSDEIGITHPISKATIKVEDDGAIMISNSSSNCIILKPNGEILINSKAINIISNNDININTPKDINISCKSYNVNEISDKSGDDDGL